MSLIVRQSTARTIMVGPVLDASGVAVTDGVVADFLLSKNGGAPAALNGSATLTHRNTGHYSLALTATDCDTVGSAQVVISDTVNACPTKDLTVVEEAVYDALFAASALGYVANAPVNVAQFGGSNLTSSSGIPEVKVNNIAANAITAASINADAITDAKVAADVTIASVTGAVGSVTGAVGSVTGAVGSVAAGGITAASFAANAITAAKLDPDVTTELQAGLATAASLAIVDGIVDDILVDTAEIGAAGAGLTAINLPNQTMDIVGNITGNLSGSVGSVTGAVGSVTAGVTLAASAIQAIWDALTAALTTANSIGKLLVDNINATISSRLPTASYTAPPSVGQIADQVWLEPIADHSGSAGSTAEALNAAGAAGDPWTTALPGAYGVGSAGKIIGDNINATISSRATPAQVATELATYDGPTNAEMEARTIAAASYALQTSVDDLEGRLTAARAGYLDSLNGNVAQTGDSFARIGASGAGLTAVPWNASWDAEVESEALDALNTILTDSIPADGTLPTARQALYMQTQFLLERSVSGTTLTVKKADGTTALFTLTLNDATTPTSITRAT
jgi:hypothetical protein